MSNSLRQSDPAPSPSKNGGRESEETSDFDLLDPHTRLILRAEETDSRVLRWALTAAVVFHVVLLLVTFPDWGKPRQLREAKPTKVYKVQDVRFEPPAAAPKKEIPKRRAKKIPIPDPTPDDPEPIVVDEIVEPTLELAEIDVSVFGIPDAPPSFGQGSSDRPIAMGAGMTPPVKIFGPEPGYTEEARQARIQGSVILQIIVDKEGTVNAGSVEVIKGLPLGLDDLASETVKTWKFKPATLEGEPVAVYYTLILNFSLQ